MKVAWKTLRTVRSNLLLAVFVTLLVVWSVGPIAWNLVMSISPEVNLLSRPPRIALGDLNLSSYSVLLTEDSSNGPSGVREGIAFRKAMWNSMVVGMLTAVMTTVISIVSGYAIARYDFAGRRWILLLIVITLPIPIVVIAIPLVRIMAGLGLMDSYQGLTLLYVAFVMPLTIWMAASYIQSLPKELEDAAHIDGCSRVQSFYWIVLPLAKPVIGAVAIISFLSAWSQFFLPLIFASDEAKQLTVVIGEFVGKSYIQKSLMAAAGTLAILPAVLLVLFFGRFIVGGLTGGGVKG